MSNFDMYQNSGYKNMRNRKRTLILDVNDAAGETHLGSGTDFNIKLFEPLIIDKHSEIYLDNCLTFNSNIGQTPQTSAFALRINEFNMNSNVASSTDNNTMFNSLIIPNDHKTVANNQGAVAHKGKKFNYVCDINPQTIHSISGKITDLAGSPMFHSSNNLHLFTYSLTGIDKDNYITSGAVYPIIAGQVFDLTETGSSITIPGSTTAVFLATHFDDAETLHFSTNNTLGDLSRQNTGTIVFTVQGSSESLTLSCASGLNPNLTLVQNPGRFIAEFSIVSV